MSSANFEFGLIGLGVMGRNFLHNVADKGFAVIGHDLDQGQVEAFMSERPGDPKATASADLKHFVQSLSHPKKIMLLVPAGKIVDAILEQLLPLLQPGDLIIDGGNSYFEDTDRRVALLETKGIHFMGTGISGGAEGARKGPSIMPGGNPEAYPLIAPVFKAAAAKFKDEPCVGYLGPKSAGNYVKMVHNGVEYGLMQLIAETYDFMKRRLGMSNSEISQTFASWNKGRLRSYLLEISAAILLKEDEMGPGDLVDHILDKAKQKGTGKWTSQNAMDLGIPVPTIDMAVSLREISALKEQRKTLAAHFAENNSEFSNPSKWLEELKSGLLFSYMVTYTQGFHLLAEASEVYQYNLNLSQIARIWRAGCIIRAALLDEFALAFENERSLKNLLLSQAFIEDFSAGSQAMRKLGVAGLQEGIPIPTLLSSLSYFDAMRAERLPLNLVQAQRDYFGSHTYERTDRPGSFHTQWQSL